MRWMSPELFDSDAYRRTKGSDCYALGMVIYEVLSRRIPFYRYSDFAIVGRVTKGERPERPGIGAFTDAVWEVLELCWKSLPRERPSIEDVLKCMKKAATSWTPAPPLSTAVPLTVDSPTSDTSIISSEESEDVDEGEVPPPSPPSDEFSAPDEPPDHQIPQPQETRSQVANLTVRTLRLVSACCIDDPHFPPICSLFLQFLFSNSKALFNHSNLTGFSVHLLARGLAAPWALVSCRSPLGFQAVEVSQYVILQHNPLVSWTPDLL